MAKIQYPIEVGAVKFAELEPIQKGYYPAGTLVSIRPCGEKYGDKTYLGLYLGNIPQSIYAGYDHTSKDLTLDFFLHNPAILVPDLNEIIFGSASWWGKIESEADLKDITNEDINNVWYVKALKQITEAERGE